MKLIRTTLLLLPFAFLAEAQETEELTPYSLSEIENYMDSFFSTYKKKKVPEEDAIAALENLQKAYRYLASKGEEKTKDEEKAQEKIIKAAAKGLKARKRPLVTLECARVLGELQDPDGAKPLFQWMDNTVLDAKAPNPVWVEYGFKSMAWIGGDDRKTLDFMRAYATGKHPTDDTVANHALNAVIEWKLIPGKDRRELFEKILQYTQGLYSRMKGGDAKQRGAAEQKYNTIKDNAMKALGELADGADKFSDPQQAYDWWRENKRRKRWEDYAGPRFRTKPAEEKKEAEG